MGCRHDDTVLLPPHPGHDHDGGLLGHYCGAPLLPVPPTWPVATAHSVGTPCPIGLSGTNRLLDLLHEVARVRLGTHLGGIVIFPAGYHPLAHSQPMGEDGFHGISGHSGLSAHGSLVGTGIGTDGSAPTLAYGETGSYQRGLGSRPRCAGSPHHGSAVLRTGGNEPSLPGCHALFPICTNGL